MREDTLSRINLDELYPPFADRLVLLVDNMHSLGHEMWATNALRSFERQREIFKIGRRGIEGEKIATKAPPGYSAHQYGVACDLCADKDADAEGLQPLWTGPVYDVLGGEARRVGLEWGGDWATLSKDRGHVQLPLKRRGFEWDPLIALVKTRGLGACWEAFDRVAW